ncbi:MAG TPA: YIP1 family protein, partial [Candidatus Polarisedimenticolia bacterium]|nr:YIP1 family protein [Candidatus Polarisedimenticolia bacterium]
AMPVLLAAILLIGLPAGVGYLFAITILLNWSCDILGGRATRKGIRMMLAYAGVPGLVALVLFGIPKLLVFGRELFLPERTWLQANPALVWGLWFGDAICFAWSLALVIKSLKILNGFSTGRAMLAAILPLGPIALIGLLFLAIVYGGILTAPPAF